MDGDGSGSGMGGSRSGTPPGSGKAAAPSHRRRLSSFSALASSTTQKVSLLGFLAIVCVFPFLFSSVSQQQQALEQYGAPGFRYEPLTAGDKAKSRPQRLRTNDKAPAAPEQPQQQQQQPQPQYEPQAASNSKSTKGKQAAAVAKPKPKEQQQQQQQQQPEAAAAAKQKKGAPVIYMDWTLPSDRFGLLNYRALESVLTHYPEAQVRVLLVAPERAGYYKYGNALPATQFEKYRKRGYDVEHLLVGQAELAELKDGQPGAAFFKREFWAPREETVFNEHVFLRTENAIQDARTNHFVRLLKLHESGGLYLDFTTLLTQPFPKGQRFWSFGQHCAADRDALNAEWGYAGAQAHYVLAAPKAQDPVLACVLRRFDDAKDPLHSCIDKAAAAAGGDGGADCLRKAMDDCAATAKGGAPTLKPDPVAWLGCQGSASKTTPLLYLDKEDAAHAKLATALAKQDKGQPSAVWMGHEAGKGLWRVYNPLVQELVGQSVQLDKWHPLQMDPSCRRRCDTYAMARSVRAAGELNATLTESELQAASYVCAPSIIIPGAFKAATSSLFTAITKHPQVLRPLKGANFKETGVYMNLGGRNHVRDRLQAFPFVEPGEPFVTADATVYYLASEASPRQIKADSPNAQVLVSLRDPLARCFSQYRYAFNNATESFPSAVEEAIPVMHECFRRHLEGVDLHALLKQPGKGAKLANDVSYCTSPLLRTPARRAILASIYLPQLLAWVDAFGRERVHVTTKEEMDRAPGAVMRGVYDFLGLCLPQDAGEAALALSLSRENVRDGLSVPEGYGLSEADMLDLSEAFQPWNQALYAFLGRDLAWPTAEESFVEAKLRFHRAVLFTAATPCEGCDEAERLLASPAYQLAPEAMEVVRLNGAQMKVMAYVDRRAGGPADKTPPYVFLDGKYVGGWKELKALHEAQELGKLLLGEGLTDHARKASVVAAAEAAGAPGNREEREGGGLD